MWCAEKTLCTIQNNCIYTYSMHIYIYTKLQFQCKVHFSLFSAHFHACVIWSIWAVLLKKEYDTNLTCFYSMRSNKEQHIWWNNMMLIAFLNWMFWGGSLLPSMVKTFFLRHMAGGKDWTFVSCDLRIVRQAP